MYWAPEARKKHPESLQLVFWVHRKGPFWLQPYNYEIMEQPFQGSLLGPLSFRLVEAVLFRLHFANLI